MIELRQTVRRLRQSPGFTLAVILTLALGIGGTAAVFSVVNGILIKPLPFPLRFLRASLEIFPSFPLDHFPTPQPAVLMPLSRSL